MDDFPPWLDLGVCQKEGEMWGIFYEEVLTVGTSLHPESLVIKTPGDEKLQSGDVPVGASGGEDEDEGDCHQKEGDLIHQLKYSALMLPVSHVELTECQHCLHQSALLYQAWLPLAATQKLPLLIVLSHLLVKNLWTAHESCQTDHLREVCPLLLLHERMWQLQGSSNEHPWCCFLLRW